MTNKTLNRLLFVAAIFMAALMLAGIRLAYAQHECQGGYNCNDPGDAGGTIDIVSGDVDIAGRIRRHDKRFEP